MTYMYMYLYGKRLAEANSSGIIYFFKLKYVLEVQYTAMTAILEFNYTHTSLIIQTFNISESKNIYIYIYSAICVPNLKIFLRIEKTVSLLNVNSEHWKLKCHH